MNTNMPGYSNTLNDQDDHIAAMEGIPSYYSSPDSLFTPEKADNKKVIGRILQRTNLSSVFDRDEIEKMANEISLISSPLSSDLMSTPNMRRRTNLSNDSELVFTSPGVSDDVSITTGVTSLLSENNTKQKESPSTLKLELQRKRIECERIRREAQVQISNMEVEKDNLKHQLELEILKYKSQLEQ